MRSDFSIRIDAERLLYNRREITKALRQGGQIVRRESRRLISRRAISSAGQFPGMDTGAMMRSIKISVGAGGGYVRIMPYKTAEMGDDFYPAYLIYGTRRGIAPRKDFMQAALINRDSEIRHAIRNALSAALRTAPA